MLISKTRKDAPTGLVAVSRPKINRLKWDKVADPQHVCIILYRYDIYADASANQNATIVSDQIFGRKYDDNDALIAEENYFYRIASRDKYNNISKLSDVESAVFSVVKRTDIDNQAINEDKLDSDAVTRDKIKNGEVLEGKIAPDAVTRDKIKNGEVLEGKIAPDAVTRDKIKNGEVIKGKLGQYSTDTDNIVKRAISGAKAAHCGRNKLWAKGTGSLKNWSGNNDGHKYTENIPIFLIKNLDNTNPSPVHISANMTFRLKVKDNGSLGDGHSFVNATLMMQFKKSTQDDTQWKAIPHAPRKTIKTKAAGSSNIDPVSGTYNISFDHRIGKKAAGNFDYRVLLILEHQRGAGRNWDKAEVVAGGSISLTWLRR